MSDEKEKWRFIAKKATGPQAPRGQDLEILGGPHDGARHRFLADFPVPAIQLFYLPEGGAAELHEYWLEERKEGKFVWRWTSRREVTEKGGKA